jgi:hypothetical protein
MIFKKKSVLVIVILILGVIGFGIYIKDSPRRGYQSLAIQCAGYASLLYIRDNGVPPETVDDLFRHGCLVKENEYIAEIPYFTWGHLKYFTAMNFNFPLRASDLEINHNRLVEIKTKKERLLISLPMTELSLSHIRELNIWLWKYWNTLEMQGHIDEEWFKIKCVNYGNITEGCGLLNEITAGTSLQN